MKFSVGLHFKTECTRIMNMVFQSKIMIMKFLIQLSVQPLKCFEMVFNRKQVCYQMMKNKKLFKKIFKLQRIQLS